MAPKYETLQSIVDQLEYCDFTTRDTLHNLKMNAAFVALKERAAAEHSGSKTATTPNMPSMPVCPECSGETTVRYMGNGKYKCFGCITEWAGKPAHVG